MSFITALLVLLQTVLELLIFIQKNPSLPESFKQSVISQASHTISVANQTLANLYPPKSSPTPQPPTLPTGVLIAATTTSIDREAAPETHQLLPKPIYNLQEIASIIHESINQERLKAGFTALSWNQHLANIAAMHSRDQAGDNTLTTDPEKPCAYLLIRHEGLTSAGFTLKDRLKNAGVSFSSAGENIAAISMSKNLIYRYSSEEGPVSCPTFSPQGISPEMSEAEKRRIISGNVEQARNLIAGVRAVSWVNREWRLSEEIAQKAVDGWMNSPGHRENILKAEFRESGVGIAEVNDYLIVTQVFLAP